MDTGTHLNAIWHSRWRVLGVALLVGGLVFALRAAQPATWVAQAGLFLVPAGGDAQDSQTDRLTAAYVELIADQGVAQGAVQRYGGGLSVPQLRERVEVTSQSAGEISVVGRGPTAEAAAALTNAVADALSVGARGEQAEALRRELQPLENELTTLQGQIDALPADSPRLGQLRSQQERAQTARLDRLVDARARLDVVRRAKAPQADRRPDGARDALLAFLLTAIIAAEVAAVAAARRQGLNIGDPVGPLETWTGLPVFRIGDDGGDDQRAAALRYLDAGRLDRAGGAGAADSGTAAGLVLHVAPLDPTPASADGAELLVHAVAERYGRATWVALDTPVAPVGPHGVRVVQPDPADLASLPRHPGDGPVVVTASSWESSGLLTAADALPGACLLLVDAQSARRPAIEEALRVLAYAGIAPAAVLLVTPQGRASWPRRNGSTDLPVVPLSPAAA